MQETFIYTPPQGEIPILYMDEHIVVAHKPSGLLTVPGRDPAHRDSLFTRLQGRFSDLSIVHRLDMDTSGIVITALHKNAHKELSRQFEKKLCHKTYVALVTGNMKEDNGTIDLPLRCDWPNRPLQMVDHELGKKAITHWRILSRHNDHTRLELTPVTGRSHQLRVHCLSMGHPILGDRFYAPADIIAKTKRLCLHAQALKVLHPATGEKISFTCEPDF